MRGGGESPFLSIVVPVYNVEKYLGQCLESLINQTLKNIEIIVVNDCSPDNSEAIVLEYMRRDERIVYLKHEENKCLGGARNTGIRAARGEYITFVDSDDYVDRDLYRNVMRTFKKTKADCVIFPTYVFNEKGYLDIGMPVTPARVCHLPAEEYALNLGFATAWNKVYRRSDLEKYQIDFPEHVYWEDTPFWVHYCCAVRPRAASLSVLGPGYWYRRHEGSINGMRPKTSAQVPRIYIQIYHSLEKYGYLEKLAEPFYCLISYLTYYMWDVLETERREEFLGYFDAFVSEMDLSTLAEDFSSEWRLMSRLKMQEDKILLMQIYTQKYQAQSDPWLLFGRLSAKEKINKIQKSFASRLLKRWHIYRFAQFVRRALGLNRVLA